MANTVKVNKDVGSVNKIEAVNFDELPNMSDYADTIPHIEKTKAWIYILVCSSIGTAIGISLYFIMANVK